MSIHEPSAARPTPEPRLAAAWEDDRGGRRASRFFQTIRSILITPTLFFRALDVARVGGSISFALWVLLPALLIQTSSLYAVLFVPELSPFPWMPTLVLDGHLALELALIPLSAALFVAYLITCYQAASAIASGKRPQVLATLRATCFGFAPMVLAIVPFVGLVVGLAWSLIVHGIALKEVHGLNRIQAFAVVSVPLLVIAIRLA
jgi:hypothetical protein